MYIYIVYVCVCVCVCVSVLVYLYEHINYVCIYRYICMYIHKYPHAGVFTCAHVSPLVYLARSDIILCTTM